MGAPDCNIWKAKAGHDNVIPHQPIEKKTTSIQEKIQILISNLNEYKRKKLHVCLKVQYVGLKRIIKSILSIIKIELV